MAVKKPAGTWPRDFVWGVSTSSFQIEGAATVDGRGPSIWDTRCRLPGKVANGDTGDVACDHYHRYAEDVALMKKLGVEAYRFSIAWPRVLPSGRTLVNEKGLDFYDRLIDACLKAGVEPWVCLYHWDLPQGLQDLGGWTNRDCAGWFSDYTALCARRYGDRVKRWATFNEFSVFTMFGFAIDWGAPGITDRDAHLRAIHHVNLAHGLGVDTLRACVKDASVGAIHNRQHIFPEDKKPENVEAAALLDEHWNGAFPEPQLLGQYPPRLARAVEPIAKAGDMAAICRPVDWFGLNHYGPIFAKAEPSSTWGYAWGKSPDDAPKSDIGWPIYPDLFRDQMVEITARYRLPIYITENGCGGTTDKIVNGKVEDRHRLSYLTQHTQAMAEAIRRGADVRGYFVWSLLDNFEWGSGYAQRFGLVYVDYKTQKRTPKASFKWYADLIAKARKGKAAKRA